ncbi:19033_t:CDS:2 [Funneliformis geosporum]|uniref:3336_t:CDS:1 n=1 Tax=Funneliformis geosporum TaxID=1117311 RepID=A0A9W4WXG7_9GLOM|nr:19033_t:CDS:2 [Funneliformis geosporum]CAI2170834.1 3336_t:CDS:2 [Funneliformis geosporum]
MQQANIPKVIIIGAGPGGLALYHALIKNKDKKEFDVKIFERESSPKERWQGYHIALNSLGTQSLLNCVPSSITSNLQKAMPNPLPDVEFHGASIIDNKGSVLCNIPSKLFKDFNELVKVPDEFSLIITYRDRLRDVLLDGVPVHWGKKCIRYEETKDGVLVMFDDGSQEFCDILVGADGINSPVRKQRLPELQIFDYGITNVVANIAVPKHFMDRFIKLQGNCLLQKTLGTHGDSSLVIFRLIPIEQEPDYKNKSNSNELHYRVTLSYSYTSKLDDVESDKQKVDDNDSASVIENVKQMIRNFVPECEFNEILLELWDLVPKSTPNDPEKYQYKTYNPTRRGQYHDIDPSSVKPWTSSRVTLLGDAVHAMNPVLGLGTNHAFQDADLLSKVLINYSSNDPISCIQKYENEMRKRSTVDVLKSRSAALQMSSPVGHIGAIIRNSSFKIINFILNSKNIFKKLIQ